MRQKTNWIFFLLIGTSLITLSLWSCDGKPEYRALADLVFINESERVIDYSGKFIIQANSTYKTSFNGVGGNGSNSQNCCMLESFQGDYNQVYLILDDALCVFYDENEGPTSLDNYEVKTIEKDHYEYTFRFIEEQFVGSVACPD